MNDQQIYALMAKTPGIRAVQIADALDAPLSDVSAALRPLVEVGDVVQTKGFSPNGHPAQVYELSDAFKKSREGKELLARLGTPAEAKPAPAAELAETVKLPAAAVEAAPPVRHGPTATKVDRAIAFITRFGSASDNQLRDVMDLPPKAYVGAYLASACKAGRVIRDGDRWKLCGAPAKPLDNLEVVGNVIIATRDHTPVPVEVKAAITEMATAAMSELQAPLPKIRTAVVDEVFVSSRDESKFDAAVNAIARPTTQSASTPKPCDRAYSCAVWLSGNVEIRKSGGRVVITHQELLEIVEFAAERRVA
jgi:hypothetical protein